MRSKLSALVGVVVLLGAGVAAAQETPLPLPPELDVSELNITPGSPTVTLSTNGRPHILVTGYWPPTNEMVRPWSQDPNQNLGEWVGENWEGRDYNIYAFLPEFPGGTGSNPKGDGDFEVDYQDTSADWWSLLPQINPIAIVTTSRANTTRGWEMEGGNGFYANNAWSSDYLNPRRPTDDEPTGLPVTQRFSSLPMQAIVDAVNASGVNVDPFIVPFDSGRFLSNYIGYHGNWWKDINSEPDSPTPCYAAGHIHVGRSAAFADSTAAMEITLRVLIRHVDALRFDQDGVEGMTVDDLDVFAACAYGPALAFDRLCGPSDIDQDGDTDLADAARLQRASGGAL